jgi:hypothetical protein
MFNKKAPLFRPTAASTLLLLAALFLFNVAAVSARPSADDSEEVTNLLSQIKTKAVELKADADEMVTFTRSKLSWKSHAVKINQIKQHVNDSGQLLAKLHDAKASGSAWQQRAIDEMTPLLQDLAASVTSTIEHLNKNESQVHMPPYIECVASNAELANDLSKLISDYVAYSEAKNESEELRKKLEIPAT